MEEDIRWLKSILPAEYTCKSVIGGIHCISKNNIGKGSKYGIYDEEHWSYVRAAIVQKYGERFDGISHIVCHNNQNFIVLIKPLKK